ncbi:hypothetical protein R1sor_017265 [Riccia sorocarpa]|uniref:Uncharacterized protein n=1 Tax=Riccia sorocarpa TaxID=122646 RepID=A0ABD3I6A4_9MARC
MTQALTADRADVRTDEMIAQQKLLGSAAAESDDTIGRRGSHDITLYQVTPKDDDDGDDSSIGIGRGHVVVAYTRGSIPCSSLFWRRRASTTIAKNEWQAMGRREREERMAEAAWYAKNLHFPLVLTQEPQNGRKRKKQSSSIPSHP